MLTLGESLTQDEIDEMIREADLGAKYLGLFSSRSLKTREKYRIVASTNTCYYSENQVFGGVTIRVLCSKRGCY